MVLKPKDDEKANEYVTFANRGNSYYKWQRARNVVGVLEFVSEPYLKPNDPMSIHHYEGREKMFEKALELWKKENLKKEAVAAIESAPVETCCCGFVRDDERTKKEVVKQLNKNWVKRANKKLGVEGFKIDFFLWTWQNASGKAETNIVLIRFFITAAYALKAASSSELDIDDNTSATNP